jgi:twinkle protein
VNDETESDLLFKGPCDKCGSSDARATYSDGHTFCFACPEEDAYVKGDGSVSEDRRPTVKRDEKFLEGKYTALTVRKISERTCRKFSYRLAKEFGETVQVADIFSQDGTELVAQKVRPRDKDKIHTIGKLKDGGLFGQQAWRDKGKMVVITEGEIDAMSVAEVQDCKWPVVSVPNGAAGAKKAIARSMQWLLGFDTIVLMFDMDEDGQNAVQECAPLFPIGRAKIAKLEGHKDASEALLAGDGRLIIDAIWGAREYRPDGVLRISDVKARALADPVIGYPWFDERLTAFTYGRRVGVYCLGAGTGVGKTDFLVQQVQFDVDVLGEKVGLFFLEQPPDETLLRVAGKFSGKSFHVPDGSWDKAELVAALDRLETDDRILFYDSFGSTEWDTVSTTIRYLAHSEGIKLFYVDNLTALAAASDLSEKEALEDMMEKIAVLAKELGVIIHLVSHLSTPEGKSHEEGGRVMIKHFKGSRAIGFWCNFMFGMERDQQNEDREIATLTTFRILKDRLSGRSTGKVIHFGYDSSSSRLIAADAPPEGQKHGFKNQSTDIDDDVPF